ncbi:hypothetical protein QP888_03665 [Corynebacterium sp. MSK297]|uniref:hypothetical protein n=1 Tax=Corynebacterium sp. MSK297 TaxID=3050221 RepID=UPI0025514621|nr:hypothetical protein [Corynebacterium sp. MSK297]MDK8845622.1 hypothetical protein [Corynebacterium sp. MSK297]
MPLCPLRDASSACTPATDRARQREFDRTTQFADVHGGKRALFNGGSRQRAQPKLAMLKKPRKHQIRRGYTR